MKQDIIDSYRKAFDEIKTQFDNIEQQIKHEATQEVSEFILSNRFEESQVAVVHLKELLEDIKFDFDFDGIESSINTYNDRIESLKTGEALPPVEKTTKKSSSVEAFNQTTKKVTSDAAFNNSSKTKNQASKPENFLSFVQEKMPNYKFNVVNVNNNILELEKNKRYYHMTLVEENLTKQDYVDILEQMNEKKNIGFICNTEDNMKNAQKITSEWVETSAEYKTKFLTIHFTTKERLEGTEGEVFETYSF